jgi:hypothetical protein
MANTTCGKIMHKSVLLIFLLFFITNAQEILPVIPKEDVVITPVAPSASKDPVVIQIIRGIATNDCLAPTYENVSWKITASNAGSSMYIVTVEFTEIPVPPNKICPMIYSPVSYGPVFKIGTIAAGTYLVVNEGKTLKTFTVGASVYETGYLIKGTVVDDPFPEKRMGLPLQGVKVYLNQLVNGIITNERIIPEMLKDSAVTDLAGNYVFARYPKGTYTVLFVHNNFNYLQKMLSLSKDTIVNVALLAKTAKASVIGKVTEVVTINDVITLVPVAGCEVIIERPIVLPQQTSFVPQVTYKAVTATDGTFKIENVIINNNGESVMVRAIKSGFTSDLKSVILNNGMASDISFSIQKIYSNSISVVSDKVQYSLATDKAVYATDDIVNIRYAIKNIGTAAVTFGHFSGECKYDFIVKAKDSVLYRLMEKPLCQTSITYITIAAGDSVVKNFSMFKIPKQQSSFINKMDLSVSACLFSDKYPQSLITVPVSVQLITTPVVNNYQNRVENEIIHSKANTVYLQLQHGQNVSFAVYSLDGRLDKALSYKKAFSAGSHVVSLENIARTGKMSLVSIRTNDKNVVYKFCKMVK